MRPNLPFVSAKHTLVTYNITLSLITKTNQGPRCFHSGSSLLFYVSQVSSPLIVSGGRARCPEGSFARLLVVAWYLVVLEVVFESLDHYTFVSY
jgi:hypothetical protein